MYNAVLLSAALFAGQAELPRSQPVQVMPPLVVGASGQIQQVHGSSGASGCCAKGGCAKESDCCPIRKSLGDCNVTWLKPWGCDDLEMKCAERKPNCCGWRSIFFCPTDCKENDCNGNGCKNGNGDKKNGDAKDGDKKNGNGEAPEEEPEEEPDLNPLMQVFKCRFPALFETMDCNKIKMYGWLQGGFTGNFDSPRDRLNYGVNFNNRSNDVLLNQAYIVLEKPLDLDKRKDEFQIGGRADFFFGHDAPYFENNLGPFNRFLGDRFETSRLTENGISAPQFYVDIHTPILTDRGLDVRVGRFYTLMSAEVSTAAQTDFYSHNYEYFVNAFTHMGVMTNLHLGDTVDLYNGLVRGWDVAFQDNNDSWAYHGGLGWKSCDQRQSIFVAWYTGPDQLNNNQNYRSTMSAYYTRKFGNKDQWRFVTGGSMAYEDDAVANAAGGLQDAEWYSYNTYLFYTIDPRLTFGIRAEWFRDDDGARTALANSDNGGASWNRPGYAGNFYDVTVGFTYRPFQNLRVRPELRFDWFDGIATNGTGSRPFNDQRDNFQTTIGFDVIWEF